MKLKEIPSKKMKAKMKAMRVSKRDLELIRLTIVGPAYKAAEELKTVTLAREVFTLSHQLQWLWFLVVVVLVVAGGHLAPAGSARSGYEDYEDVTLGPRGLEGWNGGRG